MSNNGHGKPIVALDIDGTLGDYHGHFLAFAEGWFGKSFPSPTKVNPGLKLWEFMRVPLHEYRQCKLAYRQGGMKRTMPAYDGAADLTRVLRNEGAQVWICTTRPYMRLDNIDPDTREWLNRNGIEYDAVLFDELDVKYSKYTELKRQAPGRVAAIADDLPELVVVARALFPSSSVIVRNQPYNQHLHDEPDIREHLRSVADHNCVPFRAINSEHILQVSLRAVRQWQMTNGETS